MDYKDILVFLDVTPGTPARLELAVSLCRQFNARLMGVDISTSAAFDGEWKEKALTLEAMFDETLSMNSLQGEFRVVGNRESNWKDLYAHYADLIVATQQDERTAHLVSKAVPDEVLISAGVPILVLPTDWRPVAVGESVVLAWNSSRESARAAHDSLPILKRASKVTIFEFAPPSDHTDSAPNLMQAHLAHHDIPAEIFTWPADAGVGPIDALFSCLDRQQADLIVAGAFGHSRLIEGLFGSGSGDLLRNPSVPVLMSH